MTQQTLMNTLEAIDRANQADPNTEQVDGQQLPREYAYSLHMTRWLFALEPEPSERMQIACRAQHIERWTMPRSEYGEGRKNRSEEHTSELQSRPHLVCRLLLEKKKYHSYNTL